MTWQVNWQDFRGWRENFPDKTPEPKQRLFENREEADAFKAGLQKEGITACVTIFEIAKAKRQTRVPPFKIGGRLFNANWKLHQ